MWESEPWVSRVLSPSFAAWYWLLCALLWLLLGVVFQKPRLANFWGRALGWLVLAQTSIYGYAFWEATRRPDRNPNDYFVVAALVAAPLGLVLLIALAVRLVRSPGGAQAAEPPPSPEQRRVRYYGVLLSLLALFVVGGTVVSKQLFGFTSLVLGSDHRHQVTAAEGLSACICTALGTAVLLAGAYVPAGPGIGKELLVVTGRTWLIAVACVVLPSTVLLAVAPSAMTDGALMRKFYASLDNGDEAREVLGALTARRPAKLSSLVPVLRAMRTEGAAPYPIPPRSDRSGGGCMNFLGAPPPPYYGNPQIALLSVAVARGEFAEPRAWQDSPSFSEKMRQRVSDLLAGKSEVYEDE